MGFLSILSYILIYIILPAAGIIALIFLAILFDSSAKTIKRFDDIAEDIEKKLKVLDIPINIIVNINETFANLCTFIKSRKK